jgi:hypothetical protein
MINLTKSCASKRGSAEGSDQGIKCAASFLRPEKDEWRGNSACCYLNKETPNLERMARPNSTVSAVYPNSYCFRGCAVRPECKARADAQFIIITKLLGQTSATCPAVYRGCRHMRLKRTKVEHLGSATLIPMYDGHKCMGQIILLAFCSCTTKWKRRSNYSITPASPGSNFQPHSQPHRV